jgi:hypothetical protein
MSNTFRSHKVSFHTGRTLSRPLVMSPSQTLLPPIENGTDRGEPTWVESYKWFLFSSYFNVFLVLVPLSALAHYLHWDVSLRFGFSFMAIVPLAKVLLPANDGTVNDIYISVFSFWAMLLSKCQQNLERRLLVCSMQLLGMRLKLLSALRPCSKVRIASSYTWDALFTSYFR